MSHSVDNFYACDLCQASYEYYLDLKTHLASHVDSDIKMSSEPVDGISDSSNNEMEDDDIMDYNTHTDYQGQEEDPTDSHDSQFAESRPKRTMRPFPQRSRVWKFFEKSTGFGHVCTICNGVFSDLNCTTTAMKRHMEKIHPSEWGCNPKQSVKNDNKDSLQSSSAEGHKVRTRPTKSRVWQLIKKTRSGNVCTLCKTVFSNVNNCTGTLRRHLEKNHPEEWADLEWSLGPEQPPAHTSAPERRFSGSVIASLLSSSAESRTERTPLKKKSKVWKLIKRSTGSGHICTLCRTVFSDVSFSTSTMKRHLENFHPVEWADLDRPDSPRQSSVRRSASEKHISDSVREALAKRYKVKHFQKRSKVWQFIEETGSGNVCTLCNTVFSVSCDATTTSLKRHLESKHPFEWGDVHWPENPPPPTPTVQKSASEKNISDSNKDSLPSSTDESYRVRLLPKRSKVWQLIEKTESGNICTLCKAVFSNSVNDCTGTLKRHLERHHPFEWGDLELSDKHIQITEPTGVHTVENGKKTENYPSKKKELDRLVLQMICQDIHPFSIISGKGFRKLVKALCPHYELPDRKTLTKMLLPEMYSKAKNELQLELNETEFVAVSTDIWTSVNAQSFITVTVSFIDEQWKLLSKVLETSRLAESHNAENLGKTLKAIFCKWMIQDKITCVVSDGSENIVAAIRDLKYPHVPCFANTLQLVINDSICRCEEVVQLLERIQSVVSYFNSNEKASNELEKVQIQNNKPARKLKEDIPTRWTSTLSMLERYNEEHEMVAAALGILGKSQKCLTNDELTLSRNVVQCLKPFELATTEVNAEEQNMASKVIPIVTGLQYTTNNSELQPVTFARTLYEELLRRFDALAWDGIHGLCTYLDPRLKKLGLYEDSLIQGIEENLTKQIQTVMGEEESVTTPEQQQDRTDDKLWGLFDAKVREHVTSKKQPVSELKLYNEEAHHDRKGDPCDWWRQNKQLLPNLSYIAQRYMCIPATSVPAELLFSKASEVLSAKRGCLKPETVNMVLFLSKHF